MKNLSKTVSQLGLIIALFIASINMSTAQTMGKQSLAMLDASPAGIMVIEFIRAVNKKGAVGDVFYDEVISKKLIDKHGKEKLGEMLIDDIRANDGELTAYLVNRTGRVKFEAYVKGGKSGWLKLDFTCDPEDGYKLSGIGVEGIDDAPEGADKPMKIL
jgi:hypothetical protein